MTICLNAKELLCLAALLGVPEVIAIPDAFQSLAGAGLREEIQEVRQALEQKGLLELDFDGNCTPAPAYLPCLEAVLKGGSVIMVDVQLHTCGQASCVYYRSGRRVVRSVPKDGAFELSEISVEQAAEELCGNIQWAQGERLSYRPLLISQKQLNEVKAADPREAFRELGVDDRLGAIMADALRLQSNYYSFAFLDRRSGGRLVSLIFVDDTRGALKLTPTVENDQSYILIEAADRERLKGALSGAVAELLQAGEGE